MIAVGDLDSILHIQQVKAWIRKERERMEEDVELGGSADGGLMVLNKLEAFLEGK